MLQEPRRGLADERVDRLVDLGGHPIEGIRDLIGRIAIHVLA